LAYKYLSGNYLPGMDKDNVSVGGMALGGFFLFFFLYLSWGGLVPCSAGWYFRGGGGTSTGNEMGGDGLIELGECKL
jgi:hypothetical protein